MKMPIYCLGVKALLTIIILFTSIISSSARNFEPEILNYDIKYKWGIIHKKAGTAKLSIVPSGNKYVMKLTAKSEPWADRFYSVRDTLNGVMLNNLKPLKYEKIAHEGSEDKHDVVKFSYDGNKVTGECTRKAVKKGKITKDEKRTLTAEGITVDMLSSFYYMRHLPFEKWQKGHKESINIFSGKRKETLTFIYHDVSEIEVQDKKYRCYHITFEFTSGGGKKTSDDMDAWIEANAQRVPVKLEGKLPVGKIHCELAGK